MDTPDLPPPNDPARPLGADSSPRDYADAVAQRLAEGGPDMLDFAARALQRYPTEPALLQLAAMAALCEVRPEHALRFMKRLGKRYVPNAADHVIKALALAQQEQGDRARRLLLGEKMSLQLALYAFACPNQDFARRARRTLKAIFDADHRPGEKGGRPRADRKPKSGAEARAPRPAAAATRPESAGATTSAAEPAAAVAEATPVQADQGRHPLSLEVPELSVRFRLPSAGDLEAPLAGRDFELFDLRRRLSEVALARSFDELLCLPTLRAVESHWYQEETVRKVLKQFRGQVLLADEVGLGKTIEAGMIVKEYLLRGMARRVLILTPASLVGQWREEMATKFGLEFATTNDADSRHDPKSFWEQRLVVASIAAARRPRHAALLLQEAFDIVVVDEAHHLKNRRTLGYALVNGLKRRFLILLSATPVQNNLLELYNLLTLLKPGIFRTQKDFRAAHMTPARPRVPANQAAMRELMRDVMVRNTRALVDVRIPPRHGITLRPEPLAEEGDCYRALSAHVRELAGEASGEFRLALRRLLGAAGSSPHAAATALHRFAERRAVAEGPDLRGLAARYAAIDRGAKENAFLEIMTRNPAERTMVFSHHRATLDRLGTLLAEEGLAFVRFDGSMSGPEKDAAIARFRDEVPILLSTESGGEGRNVQFANTLVNFDLPWNPMTLEQRIGRIHRIGQTRDVFIFNLATRGTVEDRLLRVLDEKINMFEMVVGEIGDILGEIDDERSFADAVFDAWIASSDAPATGAEDSNAENDGFAALTREMVRAHKRHADAKALDEALFGDDFEAT